MSRGAPGVAILGCGLIGGKRAKALARGQLVSCADLDFSRAAALARDHAGATADTVEAALVRPDVDVVIIATTNEALTTLGVAALAAGKHVLLEKPAGRSVAEIDRLIAASRVAGTVVRVGFNHRYHPALQQARALVDADALGPLMFVRGRTATVAAWGNDREWRADPAKSGGGELIDQGVHLIDLARWFLGDVSTVDGFAGTFYWDMPVDDNGFVLLRTADGKAGSLHVSCTEWKNLFSLEIYGRTGKIAIDGLGGSYGVERLAFYKMLPEMGPPETTIWEYPGADRSWALEWAEFMDDVRLGRAPSAGLAEARAALAVVETIYARSGYTAGGGRPSA